MCTAPSVLQRAAAADGGSAQELMQLVKEEEERDAADLMAMEELCGRVQEHVNTLCQVCVVHMGETLTLRVAWQVVMSTHSARCALLVGLRIRHSTVRQQLLVLANSDWPPAIAR
jgi:hypothetical protein